MKKFLGGIAALFMVFMGSSKGYAKVAPAEYIEYVCPIDGSKTVYAFSADNGLRAYDEARDIFSYRSGIEHLNKTAPKGMTFSLDETDLCKQHTPEARERSVYLVLTYDDGRTVKTAVTDSDFKILDAFFNEKSTYFSGYGSEDSLKSQTPRIKQLLGIKE